MAGKTVLMVEGNDDKHVIMHICGAHALGEIDEIRPYFGKDPLIEGVSVALKESDLMALGIVLDADTDISARWDSVRNRLIHSGYDGVPQGMDPEGLTLLPPEGTLLPRVGVWLMPDNKVPGILEDFLSFLIPAGDPLFLHMNNCVDGIPRELIKFSTEKKPKALIHSWLAVQEEPGRPMGQAISAKYLDPNLDYAIPFVDWLRRLFW
jgi:hypothetical protein